MATRKAPATAARVAAAAGRVLGTVAGKIDALKARHPNPAAEAGMAFGKGEAKVRALATEASARTNAAAARTKAAVKKTKKATKKLTKRVKKAVSRAGKTVSSRAPSLKR